MQEPFLSRIKEHLRRYKLYVFARELKDKLAIRRVISLRPTGPIQGDVLLSYSNLRVFSTVESKIPNDHTAHWEQHQIARTFLDLGYAVDVIDVYNTDFVPKKHYTFFVGHRINIEQIAARLNKDCVKILHIDAAHILFHNAAEASRLLDLQKRRRVTLRSRRFEWPNRAIEQADYAIMLGNDFTYSTYAYANKPVYRIPISTPVVYPWSDNKDWEACRRNFLWFGSGGFVHKGLDRVLEVFAANSQFSLTVCGPIDREKDFVEAYRKELYQTPNICTVGWVDVSSAEFTTITNRCIALVYPSCSEGQCGGVITCMHAGLIPIVSYESGVDVDDNSGVILRDCSIEEINSSIQRIANLSVEQLKRMARNAWEFARANHTRETFAKEYRKAISAIMMSHNKKDCHLRECVPAPHFKQAGRRIHAPTSDDPT